MKHLTTILTIALILSSCAVRFKEDKQVYNYWYIVDNWKRVNECVYVNPFDKTDTVYLGSGRKFYKRIVD